MEYGSFGWVIGTNDEVIWECEGTARGYPMQSYRAEGYGRMSLLLFLTHYIRYYNIKRRITCGHLLRQLQSLSREDFHTRDVDSSSWYLKPDHDDQDPLAKYGKGCLFNSSHGM
jgi:hypothetical protein